MPSHLSRPAGDGQIRTLLRWRSRIVLGTLGTDAGLVGAVVAAVVYLLIVLLVAVQAWAGGILTHRMVERAPEVGLQLLGLSLLFTACLQAGVLYLFRARLGTDFASRAWVAMPVSPGLLRRLRTADALLNPGATAAALGTLLLTYGAWGSSSLAGLLVCALLGIAFATITSGLLALAEVVLERAAPALFWTLLATLAAAGTLAGALLLDRLSSSTLQELAGLLGSAPAELFFRLPPWGVPVLAVERLQAGRPVMGLLIALAGVGLGLLLLRAGEVMAARKDYR